MSDYLRAAEGLFNFFPDSDQTRLVFLYYMYVSDPQTFQKDHVFLAEQRNVTPLAGLGLLRKLGWALGVESADSHYHPLGRSIHSA